MVVAPTARITLLGDFTLRLDGAGVRTGTPELPRTIQRVVAHICLYHGRPRALVAGNLWPDVPEGHAHGSLRSALWRLQRIAPGLVCSAGDGLALADGVGVDVQEIHEWARRARDPRAGVDDVRVPAGILRGELLPGWYDDWVLLERERVRQVVLHALEAAAERLSVAGRAQEALDAAHAAVRVEPLRESAHRTLVRVHLVEGRRGEALRAYQQFRELLGRELGIEPTAAMTALVADRCPPAVLPPAQRRRRPRSPDGGRRLRPRPVLPRAH